MIFASLESGNESKTPHRICNALCIIGLLLFIACFILNLLLRFEAQLYVPLNFSEDMAVRPASQDDSILPALTPHYENVMPDNIKFNIGEQVGNYYRTMPYDVVQLPFRLRLKHVELIEKSETVYSLATRPLGTGSLLQAEAENDMKATIPIQHQDVFMLWDRRWTVQELRPWVGLLHNPGGPPMANVSISIEDTNWENIFLHENTWVIGNGPTALKFAWFNSEAVARSAFPDSIPGPESGRWGVHDGAGIHWFQSFVPGTGVTLSDSTDIVLVHFDATHESHIYKGPLILVEVRQAESVYNCLVTPEGILGFNNAEDKNDTDIQLPQIFMEYPGSNAYVVYVHAWRDASALIKVFHDGDALPVFQLDEQESRFVAQEGQQIGVQIEQVYGNALPVDAAEGVLWEVVLECNDSLYRLREGDWVMLGDGHAQFILEKTPALTRQTFLVYVPGKDRFHEITLSPGKSVLYAGWCFTQAPWHEEPMDSAVLLVERRPLGPFWIKAVVLLLSGFIGKCFLWYGALRKIKPSQQNFVPD